MKHGGSSPIGDDARDKTASPYIGKRRLTQPVEKDDGKGDDSKDTAKGGT